MGINLSGERLSMKIMGKHKTKGGDAQCYGEFSIYEMYQCMKYLNTLKTGTVGNSIGFLGGKILR